MLGDVLYDWILRLDCLIRVKIREAVAWLGVNTAELMVIRRCREHVR